MFFGTLKSESFYTSKFKDIDELKIAIEDYIRYYNTRRISLRFNGLSPVEYRLKSYPAEINKVCTGMLSGNLNVGRYAHANVSGREADI
ncbi:integrase core domain-containing protein [Salmonella enterica subsp. enterica serovar Kentucky]|nr:integrase core domain-containing protein [Salmonella enterica subsp. enterica serovar Kentucky]